MLFIPDTKYSLYFVSVAYVFVVKGMSQTKKLHMYKN